MIKVWARIGITVDMTEEQYAALLRKATYKTKDNRERFCELTLSHEDATFFLKNGVADGDSYIPQEVFEDIERNNI